MSALILKGALEFFFTFFLTRRRARARGILEGVLGDIWRKFGGHVDEFWRTFAGNVEEIKKRLEGTNLVFKHHIFSYPYY